MSDLYAFDLGVVAEGVIDLDGSGNYYSDWFATGDTKKVRVGIYGSGNGAVTVQQSTSSANEYFVAPPVSVATNSAGFAEVSLVGRFFRLRVDSGAANGTPRITIRRVG